MTKQIEAEGGELILRNKNGSVAIIPARHRQEVLDMLKGGCKNCLDDYISRLPKMKDYANDGTYIIQKGDTLSALAKKNNTTVKQLATDNNIENPNLIYAGNTLKIPKKYDKELSLDEIPQEYHPHRIVDNFSTRYDYLVQGDKMYYKVKNGKTWEDISDNTAAKKNIYGFLNDKYKLKGYSPEEVATHDLLSKDKYDYDSAYSARYKAPQIKQPSSNSITFNNEEEYKASFLQPFNEKTKAAQLNWIKNRQSKNKKLLQQLSYDEPEPPIPGIKNNINTKLLPNYPKTQPKPTQQKENNIRSTFDYIYDQIETGITLGSNYFKRKVEKQSDEREPTTRFVPKNISIDSDYNIRQAEVTGDTIPIGKDKYYLPEVIDLNKVKLNTRNRGDLTPLDTKGGVVTAFNPFVSKSEIKNNKENDSFIGVNPNGQLKVGNLNDFNDDDKVTKTYKNRVLDFVRDNNGNIVYTKRNKDNPNNPVPNVKIRNDKGEIVIGSLNILTKHGKKDEGTYGNITGGRLIMKAGNETKLISGSMLDIEREFNKLKKQYGEVDIYSLDNGTYTKGIRTRDQKITPQQLKEYDRMNSSGGNFAYLDGEPENKYKENVYQTPNIRTEKDNSYKLGHPLVNENKAVVLHHTAYTEPNLDAVHKYFMQPGNNSSHVVINYDGERNVYAKPEQVTFHAGESTFKGRDNVNDFALGLEFQGDTNKKHLTEDQIYSAVEYLYPIVLKYKIPLENITTHARIAKGRKPDINEEDYNAIIAILKQMVYEEK